MIEKNKKIKYTLSRYLQIVKRDDGLALYHSYFGNLCLIDRRWLRWLKSFHSGQTENQFLKKFANEIPAANLAQFASFLQKRQLIVADGFDEWQEIKKRIAKRKKNLNKGQLVGVVQLIVANVCNFRCKYCFINSIYSSRERALDQHDGKNQIMKTGDGVKYLQKIIGLLKKNKRRTLMVQFFGGEPLANWPLIKRILNHFKNGKKYGVRIGYSIVTNGSLINEEIAQYFKKYNVPVIVSFDSPQQSDRPMKGGGKSLPAIMRGLACLKKYRNTLVFNAALTKETFPYFNTKVVDFGLKFSCREIGVLLDLDPEFYYEYKAKNIVDKLWLVYKYAQKKNVIITGYWHQTFQMLAAYERLKHRGFKTCSAMGCQLSIEPNGNIYACKGSSKYFGKINALNKIFKSKNYADYALRGVRLLPECVNCSIAGFCTGLCPGAIEKKYGGLAFVEKRACSVYRGLIKKIIRDYDKKNIPGLSMAKSSPY